MYDISALALKLLNFKFEHWCASTFKVFRKHLKSVKVLQASRAETVFKSLWREEHCVSIISNIYTLANSGNLFSAASQVALSSRITLQSRLCRVVKAIAKVWPEKNCPLLFNIFFGFQSVLFINYPLPIRELRLREDTVTDRRFRWMVSLNEQMIWFQIDHSSIINNQRIIYRLLLENRLHMTPWFILSKLWTILGTNSQLSWVDGFERLILNGFKTEDIFLSHGCNKNNKNVECKNKSFREEKVQLVKQLSGIGWT